MRAGLLRHRITIEALSSTQNEYGEEVSTWATFVTAWAAKEDLTGGELFGAQQVSAEVGTRFTLRYRNGITPKMRVLNSGDAYNIEAVLDQDGKRRWLHLLCTRTD